MPAGMPMPIFSASAGRVMREGRRHALQHEVDGGPPVAHRLAEVAGEGVADIGQILVPDRLVEAPGFAEGRDRLGRRVDRHDQQRRIARQAQHHEGEGHHEQDGEARAQQARGGEHQHQAATCRAGSWTRWQATMRPPASGWSVGASARHCAVANGQRVWKAQPGGTFTGLGGSPCSSIRSRFGPRSKFTVGIAATSARV
jgi:hypothetical protein